MKKIVFPLFLLCLTQICVGQQYFNKLIDLGDGGSEAYSDLIYDDSDNTLWVSVSVTGFSQPKIYHFDLNGNTLIRLI